MNRRQYTRRLQFYQVAAVSDSYGGSTVTETLITESWCNVKTVPNSSRYVSRLTDLGVTDPTNAIIITTAYRNDIVYNAINQYVYFDGSKFIIQTNPTNIDINNKTVELIAVREATTSVPILNQIT